MRRRKSAPCSAKDLVKAAVLAQKMSYAPYSKFYVGAAILGDDGNIYTGVNVENASYGLTLCAERSAAAQAVASGCRAFRAIAVAERKKGIVSPCGACRQVLMEFSPEMKVVLRKGKSMRLTPLKKLLPENFSL